MRIAIVFWSATGNTQQMAEAIASGAEDGGAEVRIARVGAAPASDIVSFDVIALGSPAMGDEVIEETDMEPFVRDLESMGIMEKRMFLFGSYDWGDGKWMRDWEARMKKGGAIIAAPSVIAHNAPDNAVLAELACVGRQVASLP